LARETPGAAIAALAWLAKPHFGRLYVAKFQNPRADLYAERCRISVGYVVPLAHDWAPAAAVKRIVKADRHQIRRHRSIHMERMS
jgi:hypothetical protein